MPAPSCRLRILSLDLRVLPMRTRFPFRYGIASLTAVPHVFVQAEVEVDGEVVRGYTSEGLPPKWFTKNPRTTAAQDLADLIAVVQNAVRLAPLVSKTPVTFHQLWQLLHKEQGQWGFKLAHPPLLWHFGVSMVERAALDAVCRKLELPLHQIVKSNALGVDWGRMHPGLDDHSASDFLPEAPLETIHVRHTVGLVDPILVSDIAPEDRLHDGLPQALEECIPAYGLRYFKIKVSGEVATDLPRLRTITGTLLAQCGDKFHVTLDGNENFADITSFRTYFEKLQRDAPLKSLLERLLWVEQPLHRDKALVDSVGQALLDWPQAPALIIDESDGTLGDAHKALRLGYSGVSHKNCKGILKGLANAALVHHHRRLRPKKNFIHSGEDLCIPGPVALMQDLAMHALLGITHVERNGHHYFRGLTPYPAEIAEPTVRAHPDLYATTIDGLTTLKISLGDLSIKSVNEAPFGYGAEPNLSSLPTLKDWVAQGGIQTLA
ncbi:MAG: hypothetical protein ACOYMN_12050 [Roseimicrobium sp.]